MYCECYDPPTESTVTNSFPPGAFPEYRLYCTQLSNGTWHCSPVEQQCVGFVELEVVCINYEEYYERSSDSTLYTQFPTSSEGKLDFICTCTMHAIA